MWAFKMNNTHTLLAVTERHRAFRCGVGDKSLFEKRDPLRDPRLLCGGLRPRPLETANLRGFVRVALGRGLRTFAYSAAVCVGGLVPGKGFGLGFSLSGPTSGEGSGVRTMGLHG